MLWWLQSQAHWSEMENWLQQRYAELQPENNKQRFRVLGYQWRVLQFNDNTRQSAAKIMAACLESDPRSIFFMQQAHCLAVPCKVLLPFSSQLTKSTYISSL